MLPDICARPEVGRITGRGNTANLEVRAGTEARSHSRRRFDRTDLCFARHPRAGADRNSLCAARRPLRRDRRDLSHARRADAPAQDAEALADYAAKHDADTIPDARRRGFRRSERPRVYYARGPRGLETGLGGSINVETIELLARAMSQANARAGSPIVSIEQVLLWNPDVIVTIDRDFAANVEAIRSGSALPRCSAGRVHLSPKMPFGWVDFPPSVNRLIGLWWLAQDFLSGAVSRRHPRDHPRLLHALLSRDADGGADRQRAGGTGVECVFGMTRSAPPACSIALLVLVAGLLSPSRSGRYPVALADLFAVLVRQAHRPRLERRARDRDRDPAGARSARARGRAGRCGARGGRHRVPGTVPQSAGLAGHSWRVVRRGARRGARHLLLARHFRDPGARLRRRTGRGRRGLRDRLGGARARSDAGAGARRRRDRLAARRRCRPGQISRRSL